MKIIVHEVNGLQVSQGLHDGYINLTQMAKAYGKRVYNWLRLKDTEDLLKEFEEQEKLNNSDVSDLKPALIVKRGKHEGGTWGHPDIAIQFAQWLDKGFALQVSRWVREWMTIGQNPLPSTQPPNNLLPDESISTALDLLNEVQRQINLARLYRHAAHNITDQPLISRGINRVVHRAMHEQGNVLNDCLSKLADLRSAINQAVDKTPVQPSSASIESPVIEVQPTPEPKQLPNYLTLVRKETRLTASQLEQLTIKARKLGVGECVMLKALK
jgi:hypothetical protein